MAQHKEKNTEEHKLGMHSSESTVVFAAGASGGHIFPALAIANDLKSSKANTKTTFIGSGSKVEKQILGNRENIEYFHICLLYTSPSPRDRQKSRMPSSA